MNALDESSFFAANEKALNFDSQVNSNPKRNSPFGKWGFYETLSVCFGRLPYSSRPETDDGILERIR